MNGLRMTLLIALAIAAGWAGSILFERDGFVAVAAADGSAATWGNLSGRFVYGGAPPVAEKLELNKDIDYCSPFDLRAEKLRVHPENRGIANVVLWLDMPGRATPPIHESYTKTAQEDVLLANDKCRFSPHVTTLRTTQTLVIKNDDTIAHNTSAYLRRNLPFNAVSAAGSEERRSVRRTEREPVKISCSIHSWMTGWLLVKDHPYMAVTDEEGRFSIKHLPAGEWTFQVWHEVPTKITAATKDGQAHTWEKGRLTLTIAPGENDFGQWTLDPKLFE